MKYLILILCPLLLFIFNNSNVQKDKIPGNDDNNDLVKMYCWVDKLNVRAEPALTAPIITRLDECEEVYFLNKESDFKKEITLRGKRFNEPFLLIKTWNRPGKDLIGWVYGGGLRTYKVKMFAWVDKLNVREKPGLKGEPILQLDEGEEVYFLNEKSDFKKEITLRGVTFNEPFLKIKTMYGYGTIGWVYGGGLMPLDIKILTTGPYHGDEIWDCVEKEEWVGIFKKGQQYVLSKTDITVEMFADPIVDDPGGMTGKKVSTDQGSALILITGISDIKPGILESVQIKKNSLYPGESFTIGFHGTKYKFSASGNRKYESNITDYRLEVESTKDGKKSKQVIGTEAGFDDTMYQFIWLGDIDRDGELDLIMDLSNHYNVGNITLFLSSKAYKGQLFQRVSLFRTVGC